MPSMSLLGARYCLSSIAELVDMSQDIMWEHFNAALSLSTKSRDLASASSNRDH
jgi:hypothetical protein